MGDPSQPDSLYLGLDSLAPDTGDIELLIQATLNEKNAPEVLHFKEDLVQRLQSALETQVWTPFQPRFTHFALRCQ